MRSVLEFKQKDGWFLLPSNKSCDSLESAINSYYEINFCGCGNRESALELIYRVLDWSYKMFSQTEKDLVNWEYLDKFVFNENEGIKYFVLYQLDNWGLTEHGGSVNGSWLTDKGKLLLEDLKNII